ncbi:alpha/beta hydrolase family protein [Brevundimonas sp.]|jgi:alpha-beta hydrolase superfamily lysophospholipase|uniref:alpha/beta hydrolase family protein n=1 Tax=Brevundimonas sp. TaxID=1871086 RepID=UPI0037C04BC2
MSIRALLASAVLLAAPLPAFALQPTTIEAATTVAPTIQSIPAPDGRTVSMHVWTAPDEKGVIVFSHGFGGAPEAYDRLLAEWAGHGFTVIAPLHVDSQLHPQRRADGATAFSTRLMDLGVARAAVEQAHPGKPLIVAGHSFGSLMSLIEAGALTPAGPLGDPAVKGVIAFSSPGNIPGVVTGQTYAPLAAPLLMITGDKDLVPGFADDWQDHRTPFDASPAGDKTLLVFHDGDHQLVKADETFAPIVAASEAFLDAYALGDAEAKARLAAFAAPGVIVERR